jgi:site-specific DNA-methyltransferase (adenine-specific)
MIVDVLEGRARWCVELGDCLDVLRSIPDASVDALVCDPPSGIAFMGSHWDTDKGGRDHWVAWLADRMREAFRVMKPGAHGAVWALPRTSHWAAYALENAGFEICDRKAHIFGSGFPKSVNVVESAIAAGRPYPNANPEAYELAEWMRANRAGFGTALKPAVEDWWIVRKPRRDTIVRTLREHGTGAINIDACRVPHASQADLDAHAAGVAAIKARGGSMDGSWKNSSDLSGASDVTSLGRWPSHLLLSHAEGCELVGTKRVKAPPPWAQGGFSLERLADEIKAETRAPSTFTGPLTSTVHYADGEGFELVDDWQCVDGCPVKLLDEQSGATTGHRSATSDERVERENMVLGVGLGVRTPENSYDDEGGASRYFTTFAPFFYTTKAKRADREKGCEHLPERTAGELTKSKEGAARLASPRTGAGRLGGRRNSHPTVKSTDLMRWIVRLVTPPNGIVLDPFTGSGSTGVACSAEGARFIGVEAEPEYVTIARARIVGDAPLLNVGGLPR